ncbi:MAG: HD-GYP domain-containing protein [candidate division Zixibacteria bacterium]|nr:HD-GYP domain-containing protein [candidate division Zixibacteria bacterium]
MLEEVIRNRISRQLADTRLRQIIGQEVAGLLAFKPDDMDTIDYCKSVAELLVHDLHLQLCTADGREIPGLTVPQLDDPPDIDTPDLDAIIRRLASGVEYALLSGNLQMVRALGEAIAKRDTGSSMHNPRVTLYATRLAVAMGLNDEAIQALIKGSFLHDIGKIGIPDSILMKEGMLTGEERGIMESHPEMGAQMIGGVKWLQDSLEVVRHHHERYDGSGYPDGLKGEDIPLNARIFMIGDVFDALTSTRPYKRSYSFDSASAMLREREGVHFCPIALRVFLEHGKEWFDELTSVTYHRLQKKLFVAVARHFDIDPRTFAV